MQAQYSSLRHAASVIGYYAGQLERGWSHPAVCHAFCAHAQARLSTLDDLDNPEPGPTDRGTLRRVAMTLRALQPNGYPQTVADLLALAGPGSIYDRGRPRPWSNNPERHSDCSRERLVFEWRGLFPIILGSGRHSLFTAVSLCRR